MSSQQLLVEGIEHTPLAEQGGLLRPKTVGTAESPLEAPLVLTPEDMDFILGVEADLFGGVHDDKTDQLAEPESALTPEDMDFILGVEADLFGGVHDDIATEEPPKAPGPREQQRHSRARRLLGRVSVAAMLVVGLAGGAIAGSVIEGEPTRAGITQDAHAQEPTTTVGSTTSTEAPASTEPQVTTTTEQTPAPYEAHIGQVIGALKIPKICQEIQVVAFSEEDKIEDRIGNGTGLIDALTPDPTPTESCPRLDAWVEDARTNPTNPEYNPNYRTRSEWVRNSARGHVDQWQPVAGFEMTTGGAKTSMYPGEPGNAVIPGHGSTYSAPFADLNALDPGDVFAFERSDGVMLWYRVIGQETESDYFAIRDYQNPDYSSTISLYNCSNEQGQTGSDATRRVTRAGLVATSTAP